MALPSILPFRRNQEVAPPSDPFVTLRREMDRLFDDAFRGFGFGPSFGLAERGIWAPSVDVRETENSVEVAAELPGVDEKDIELTVADGVLTIRGEKKIDRQDKGEGWHRIERSHGTFVRSIPLPMEVDEGKANAEFKNGVLHVSLPAAPEAERKMHRIKVKSA
jgi:HSP20 family protein